MPEIGYPAGAAAAAGAGGRADTPNRAPSRATPVTARMIRPCAMTHLRGETRSARADGASIHERRSPSQCQRTPVGHEGAGGSGQSKNGPRIRRHADAMSTQHLTRERLVALGEPVFEQAIGRQHRRDPVLPRTGGPAGNARLTAWTGLVLLALFLAELVTLLDVHGLMSWHVTIGALLIPPALLKTGSTGWRIVRYYRGNDAYRAAGPPPLLLRVLGPLVVFSTLAVLGTGIWLIVVGPDRSRSDLIG